MYESATANNNNNNTPASGKDMGASPVRQTRRMAPPTPPSPREEIRWGDRKPAAKPTYVYKHSPDVISDIEVELEESKDGILLPRNSPARSKKVTTNAHDEKTKSRNTKANHRKSSNEMSKRELVWASIVFVLIVLLTVTITVFLMNQQQTPGNVQKNANMNSNSPDKKDNDGMSPISIPPNGSPNGGSTTRKISVREEWELVQAAILGNNVTRPLLEDGGLPQDLFFYDHLVSGMIFSEEQRDWIPAPLLEYKMDDDVIAFEGMNGMSMEGFEFGNHGTNKRTVTPNQKATAWLLFYDELKDPNESVWRWSMASIYFKMGGANWSFHDSSNSKWLTSAPLCEWELFLGGSGCERHQSLHLPVELDFDDTNMAGEIAIEFALLMQPTTANTMVRSIMLSDNRLTGTIPGKVFQHLMPSLGKLYLDNNQLMGPIPVELGGLGTLYSFSPLDF